MAGTLFGLPLSIQFDEAGRRAAGGLLYVYDANTSTPAITYADFGLTSVQTHPIQLDASGRIPSFYVSDGSYRARLTTSAGVELFDEQAITSIGASASSGSSGGGSADTETIFQTGDVLWLPVSGTRPGWVRGNGLTIGSGASAATERPNSDTQALFEYFWTNFSDSLCPVGGGRGASATADFNNNKVIATLDMRSKGIFGLDSMGGSAANVTGGSNTAATALGASTYTVALANLPATTLTHSLTVSTTITYVGSTSGAASDVVKSVGQSNQGTASGGNTVVEDISPATTTLALKSSLVTGNINLGGSGTDIDILPPVRVGTFYFKL